jgi:hypothetical protein
VTTAVGVCADGSVVLLAARVVVRVVDEGADGVEEVAHAEASRTVAASTALSTPARTYGMTEGITD